MTYNKSQQIGAKGEKLVDNCFTEMGWQARPQEPDYHKDFYVEIFENCESTGEEFICSVKTSENFKVNKKKKKVSQRIETSTLAYYMDKVKHPVFLILVDLPNRKIYYLFLQEFLRAIKKEWRKQKYLNIQVPSSNALSVDKAMEFHIEVRRALKFMGELYPGSIVAAIQRNKSSWESLDDRFTITTSLKEDIQEHMITASEPVAISFRIQGDRESIEPRLDELINKGRRVAFARDEVSVNGSPLFEHIFGEGTDGFEIQAQWKRPVLVSIRAIRDNNVESARLDLTDATLSGGKQLVSLEATLEPSPLSVSFEFDTSRLDWNCPTQSFPICIKLDPEAWEKQNLLGLAYFDQLDKLYSELEEDADWFIEISQLGYPLLASNLSMSGCDFEAEKLYLALIRKARMIGRKLGVNCPLPRITRQHASEIEFLFELITTGEAVWHTRHLEVSFFVPYERYQEALGEERGRFSETVLHPQQIQTWPFLGGRVTGLNISFAISAMRHVNLSKHQEAIDISNPPENVELTLVASDDARKLVRLHALDINLGQ